MLRGKRPIKIVPTISKFPASRAAQLPRQDPGKHRDEDQKFAVNLSGNSRPANPAIRNGLQCPVLVNTAICSG